MRRVTLLEQNPRRDKNVVIKALRDALFRDIPQLQTLDPFTQTNRAVELIQARIDQNRSLRTYARDLGVWYVTDSTICPVFDGKLISGIVQSFPEFNLEGRLGGTRVYSSGKRMSGEKGLYQDETKLKSLVLTKLKEDIPPLEDLLIQGLPKKTEIAALIRENIESAGGISEYFTKLGIQTAATKGSILRGDSSYNVIAATLHPYVTLDTVMDLGDRFRNWDNPETLKSNMLRAMYHHLEGLEILMSDPSKNKQRILGLVREAIVVAGDIDAFHKELGTISVTTLGCVTGGYAPVALALSDANITSDDLTKRPSLEYKLSLLVHDVQPRYSPTASFRAMRDMVGEQAGFGVAYTLGVRDKSYNLAAIVIPSLLWRYVGARTSPEENQKEELQTLFDGPIFPQALEALDRINELKLCLIPAGGDDGARLRRPANVARAMNDRNVTQVTYSNFIRDLFADNPALDVSLEAQQYLATGEYQGVAITEEKVAESKHPNYRVRVFLSTNRSIDDNSTLDAFVKFYRRDEKDDRDRELKVNRFLMDAGIGTTCNMRAIKLHNGVRLERENESDTMHSVHAPLTPGSHVYTHALVTPFRNITSVSDYLADQPALKKPILRNLAAALHEFHIKGYQAAIELTEFNIPVINYEEQSARFIQPSSDFGRVYSTLGIGQILNYSRDRFSSLTHGDLHPRNIIIDEDQKGSLIDYETIGIGAPQIDHARLYTHRDLALSMEEQDSLISDEVRNRNLDDGEIVEFIRGYHASVIFKTIEHMDYIKRKVHLGIQYDRDEALQLLSSDVVTLYEHASKLTNSQAAEQFAKQAQIEYNFFKR